MPAEGLSYLLDSYVVSTVVSTIQCQSFLTVMCNIETGRKEDKTMSATLSPPVPTTPQQAEGGPPLRAKQGILVDAAGKEAHLTGINWFGMETETQAPHGLWLRNWQEFLDIIRDSGFNTIRLPYSNDVLNPSIAPVGGMDYTKNPDLQGVQKLDLMDRIIEGAGERGLGIILDRHRPSQQGQSELWYTDHVSEQRWIADWVTLAQRYLGNTTVIGADLHNEPHGRATWGDNNHDTDWRLAAERAGNAILAINPDWLIFVEGIEKCKDERGADDWFWWGGNLMGAKQFPVRLSNPEKLVYSAHDYGIEVSDQGWFHDPNFPQNLPAIWEKHWAFLALGGLAPVLVGEFGGAWGRMSNPIMIQISVRAKLPGCGHWSIISTSIRSTTPIGH